MLKIYSFLLHHMSIVASKGIEPGSSDLSAKAQRVVAHITEYGQTANTQVAVVKNLLVQDAALATPLKEAIAQSQNDLVKQVGSILFAS